MLTKKNIKKKTEKSKLKQVQLTNCKITLHYSLTTLHYLLIHHCIIMLSFYVICWQSFILFSFTFCSLLNLILKLKQKRKKTIRYSFSLYESQSKVINFILYSQISMMITPDLRSGCDVFCCIIICILKTNF